MPRAIDTTRECCLTRQVLPVEALLRFVVSPEGELFPDVDAKAPGRGVWVTATAEAVAEAERKGAFARGLKQKVTAPQSLAKSAREGLEQRLSGALGLARKAGQAIFGATRVRAAIDKGEIIALFTAADAAADGRNKMRGAARTHAGERDVPHFEFFTSGQLGLALGGENVIHAALVEGAAARAALKRAERLARFLGLGGTLEPMTGGTNGASTGDGPNNETAFDE